jgi:hypothetical protein
MARAAHARAAPPHVIVDPLAERLLSPELVPAIPSGGASLHVVTRSRTAEDAVEAGYARGCRQFVVEAHEVGELLEGCGLAVVRNAEGIARARVPDRLP